MPGIVNVVAFVESDTFIVQTAKDTGQLERNTRIGQRAPECMPKMQIGVGPQDNKEVARQEAISKIRIGNSRRIAAKVLEAKDVDRAKAKARASKRKHSPHPFKTPAALHGPRPRPLSAFLHLLRV